MEIQSSLQFLPAVSVIHVKGHQDSRRSVDQLPLMAQLNVETDALATLYQNQFGSHKTHVIMSPNAGANLVTSEGTVTAKYKEVILEKSTSPALRTYIQEKNSWTAATMEMVNWSAHGKAFRSQSGCTCQKCFTSVCRLSINSTSTAAARGSALRAAQLTKPKIILFDAMVPPGQPGERHFGEPLKLFTPSIELRRC